MGPALAFGSRMATPRSRSPARNGSKTPPRARRPSMVAKGVGVGTGAGGVGKVPGLSRAISMPFSGTMPNMGRSPSVVTTTARGWDDTESMAVGSAVVTRNIHVTVRFRPISAAEAANNDWNLVDVVNATDVVLQDPEEEFNKNPLYRSRKVLLVTANAC